VNKNYDDDDDDDNDVNLAKKKAPVVNQ